MNSQSARRPFEVLLVEDNPGDVRLTREALRSSRRPANLTVVGDGVEALAFLHRQGRYERAPRPDLILLDLNLPRKTGGEVLAEIKSDDQLQSIPVVILTTSRTTRDIIQSYHMHVNCYIAKPVDLDQFMSVVRAIESFWLALVELPPAE
jgi:chemotaxis family two-component system response regulator Rcp1